MTFSAVIIALVALQRFGELLLSRRNTSRLLAKGAIEAAPLHYAIMVGVHGAWFAALWIWGRDHPVNMYWLAAFVGLQCLRVWIIATLGTRWTTRIIVIPGAELVTTGPYRFLSHPNYAVVAGEIAVLPLALNLPAIALVFSILNAAILGVRIQAENQALKQSAV
jgi:methyltransferase